MSRELRREAAARLRAAGVASPEYDADVLLAHVMGLSRGEVLLSPEPTSEQRAEFERLLSRRAAREPLQHLTGVAHFRHVTLAVGPGAFVPRPETELLAGWAIDELRLLAPTRHHGSPHSTPPEPPLAVDLGTGSGAIARAIADEVPEARVCAAELSAEALVWAERNLAGTGVELRQDDLATAFPDLDGLVDVVVSNPPYVPLEAWESVAVEARDHDPHLALFSGDDGLVAIRALEVRARTLLRPGGVIGVEHADVQGESAPAIFSRSGHWREVRDHRDLAGRARFVTARLAP